MCSAASGTVRAFGALATSMVAFAVMPGQELPAGVVGEDDDVVGDDVVERLRVDANLRDGAVENFVRIGEDRKG